MKRFLLRLILVAACGSAAAPASQDEVRLDFPETVEVKVVVDYVATSLGLNVLYADESLGAQKVALRVTRPVPKSALLGLLRSVLRTRGLALVEAEQPGWLRVVKAEQLAVESGPPQSGALAGELDDASAITQVFELRHGDAERVKTALTPYLSKPGGSLLSVPEANLLVVTDFARHVRRMQELIALLDAPPSAVTIETLPVQHQDAADLAALVTRLLASRSAATPAAPAVPLTLQAEPLVNGIIATGPPGLIARARELVARFDVPIARRTELYQPRYIKAARLRSLAEKLIGPLARMVVDDESNTLVLTAADDVHVRLRELQERFDSAPSTTSTPLRFYKLLNRRADDVFATLGALLGVPLAEDDPNQPAHENGKERPAAAGDNGQAAGQSFPPRPPEKPAASGDGSRAASRVTSLQGSGFSISLDEHTNSIIAIASPELHQQIATLVAQLDLRRPQVLVEVTLVSVAHEDSLNLGAELNWIDLADGWGHLLFSSFGLSTYNPTTGQRRLNVLPGGTGVLLGPEEVPLIVQALQTRGNTRVYSAPRILVDDNAQGTIESVAESPFTSVNASDTVATTSFAGFAKAGTQLSIEPHIAEGDHLELIYTLTVSSFTGAGSTTTPPPRSSDTITSTVRVPDGYTAVVGGLVTQTLAESVSQVPLAGDIPVIGWLFGTP